MNKWWMIVVVVIVIAIATISIMGTIQCQTTNREYIKAGYHFVTYSWVK